MIQIRCRSAVVLFGVAYAAGALVNLTGTDTSEIYELSQCRVDVF